MKKVIFFVNGKPLDSEKKLICNSAQFRFSLYGFKKSAEGSYYFEPGDIYKMLLEKTDSVDDDFIFMSDSLRFTRYVHCIMNDAFEAFVYFNRDTDVGIAASKVIEDSYNEWVREEKIYKKPLFIIGDNISEKLAILKKSKCEDLGEKHTPEALADMQDLLNRLECEAIDRRERDIEKLYYYSFFYDNSKQYTGEKFLKLFYEMIRKDEFTPYDKLTAWNYLKRRILMGAKLDFKIKDLYDTALTSAYEYCKKRNDSIMSQIPKQERNHETVLVITLQFLNLTHSPTKTALERIYTLSKQYKNVTVINAREQYTGIGDISIYKYLQGTIVDEYNGAIKMKYKDIAFTLLQPENEMPENSVLYELLLYIRELKPYIAFVIGDGCILGDLCSNIVPTVSIPVTISKLTVKPHEFTAIGRKLTDEDRKTIIEEGGSADSVIESVFTFELKEQKTKLTKKALGLPEDKFLIFTAGIRLDADISDEFITAMEKLYDRNIHMVFAGYFDEYGNICRRHPGLREHSTFVGYQDDILALTEIIDLYVNPKRVGGGFSIIEAFYHKKPGVTIDYGDVAASCGEEFCVPDYDAMCEMIVRYITDRDFYKAMSLKAAERYVMMTDSRKAMDDIIKTAESRPLFF